MTTNPSSSLSSSGGSAPSPEEELQALLAGVTTAPPAFASATSLSGPQPSSTSEESTYIKGGDTIALFSGDGQDGGDLKSESAGKRLSVVSFKTKKDLIPLCLGFIGSTKSAFCLKSSLECAVNQKGGSHASSKFSPDLQCYYIAKNTEAQSAWVEPSLPFIHASLLHADREWDMSVSRTFDEWRLTFKYLKSEPSLESTKALQTKVSQALLPDITDSLKTPRKV